MIPFKKRRTVFVRASNIGAGTVSRIIDKIKREREMGRIGVNLIIEKAEPLDVLKTFKEAQRSRIYSEHTTKGTIKLVRERISIEEPKINLRQILEKYGEKASYVLHETSDGRPELFVKAKGKLYHLVMKKKV